MVKILFVISNVDSQGPVNQLFYLCKYLNKLKIKPIVITTTQTKSPNSLRSKFDECGIIIYDLNLSKINSMFKARSLINQIVNFEEIDIIQSFGFRSDIIVSGIVFENKITTVRNTLLYNWKITKGFFLGGILGRIHLYFIKQFNHIITCSLSLKQYLNSIGVVSYSILNSIDPLMISEKPVKTKLNLIKVKLGLPTSKLIYITVSSNLKGKNVNFILESFDKEKNNKRVLIVAGFVPKKTINTYIDNKSIFFVGKVNNLNEYLTASNFFISASLHEGMPNAVLESLAVGTPVILSDIPPHEEILAYSEKICGMIFKNCSYLNFKSVIKKIEKMNYQLLSINSNNLIKDKFDASITVKLYEDFFLKLNKNEK